MSVGSYCFLFLSPRLKKQQQLDTCYFFALPSKLPRLAVTRGGAQVGRVGGAFFFLPNLPDARFLILVAVGMGDLGKDKTF